MAYCKSPEEGENIQAPDYLENPFNPYRIMNQTTLEGKPNVINPGTVEQKRLEELKFFEGFILRNIDSDFFSILKLF